MNVCLKARNSIPTTRKSRVAGPHASESLDADTGSGTDLKLYHYRLLFLLAYMKSRNVNYETA